MASRTKVGTVVFERACLEVVMSTEPPACGLPGIWGRMHGGVT